VNGNPVGEYVVKFRSNIETGNAGLLRELVGNLLADQLGLDSPEPAIVEIQTDLASAMTDQRVADAIRRSEGSNFGSRFLSGGYYAWPDDKLIAPSIKQAATDIFVFDALIQNPDRRRGKPNVLWKGDELAVIDHEMAFSFLLSIIPVARVWSMEEQPYLENHIFFQGLRHTTIDLARLTGAIEGEIDPAFWDEVDAVVPANWKGTEFGRIRNHIESVQQHLEDFMNDVRRILQ
jgi:hypothetical protein